MSLSTGIRNMFKMLQFASVTLFLCLLSDVVGYSQPGLWKDLAFDKDKGYLWFSKSMYKDTVVSLKIDCTKPEGKTVGLKIEWLLRYSPCADEFQSVEGTENEKRAVEKMMEDDPPQMLYDGFDYDTLEYMRDEHIDQCNNHAIYLPDKSGEERKIVKVEKPKSSETSDSEENAVESEKEKSKDTEQQTKATPTSSKSLQRRDVRVVREAPKNANDSNANETATVAPMPKPGNVDHQNLVKVWKSGYYVFIVRITAVDESKEFSAKVTVSMKGKVGYISAVDWPLLIFYGVMGLVYIIFGLVWLVLLACNWRDLMRLQYWIGGVIVLGMLEKAVFYADYQSIANNGQSVTSGAIIFAEIVSSLKRALARMLVIIVSVGFGIVKPRLGPTFHKVLFVGGLYFIMATIEGTMRSLKPKGTYEKDLMIILIPLCVIDASVCWWIFSSLVQTTRQLRLRRNIVKLSLYRHFSNTLIFAVLASIIFMIWSVIQIKMKQCIKDWQEIWLDEAFWHLLFSVILAVIMILWRPSSNNQRYAFSPLIDAADDEGEEDETVLNDAFDGMKNRTKQANGSPRQKQNSIEDDLKWVEENIPSTLSDKAQSLMESDEEIMTVKYEMSKMQ